MSIIQDALRSLGVTRNYRGYRHLERALELALENEERLRSVTNDIYREVAMEHGCSWSAVERDIRTLVQRTWRISRARLIDMAGFALDAPPTASEFIAIIASYLLRFGMAQDKL